LWWRLVDRRLKVAVVLWLGSSRGHDLLLHLLRVLRLWAGSLSRSNGLLVCGELMLLLLLDAEKNDQGGNDE
jgi:hypothetical protein